MKNCPNCNAEILDNAEFCIYCMTSLNDKKTISTSVKRKTPASVYIIICVLLILLALVLMLMLEPDKTAPVGYAESSNRIRSTDNMSHVSSENGYTRPSFNSDGSTSQAFGSSETENIPDNTTTSSNNSSTETSTSSTETVTSSNNSSTETSTSSTETVTSSNNSSTSSEESSSLPPSSSNETSSSDENKQIFKTKAVDGGVEITEVDESILHVTIPAVLNGQKVVGIADYAFYCSDAYSFFLPETIKYIGEKAFTGCDNITEIVIPSSVTDIRLNAFTDCENLSKVYIKSTTAHIHTYAFSSSYQRKSTLTIYAPSSVTDSTTASLFWDAKYVEWYG